MSFELADLEMLPGEEEQEGLLPCDYFTCGAWGLTCLLTCLVTE